MKTLEPPSSFYLSFAAGWFELGNIPEAREELKRIDAAFALHPSVLRVRWMLDSSEKNWESALKVAQELVKVDPSLPEGWLNKAYASRRVRDGGVKVALEALRPALETFPEEPTIPYNLACYACQLQNLDEARKYLKRAFSVGGKKAMKQMALGDEDLKPLWPEIGKL